MTTGVPTLTRAPLRVLARQLGPLNLAHLTLTACRATKPNGGAGRCFLCPSRFMAVLCGDVFTRPCRPKGPVAQQDRASDS